MSELYDKIAEAKEKLSDTAAEIIATGYPLEHWSPDKGSAKSIFNPNDNTPSMMWSRKEHFFKDFSTGRVYGLIDYYMDKYNESYLSAARRMLDEAKVEYNPKIFNQHDDDKEDYFKDYRYPREEKTKITGIAKQYVEKRGISEQTMNYVDLRSDNHNNVVFQLRDLDGRIIGSKYRPSHRIKPTEPKMFWQPGASVCPALYNANKIDPSKPLLIVEGFFDCLACIEAGYTNVVSIPGGAQDDNWIRFNYSWLEDIEEIILWFDNDEAGREGMKKILPRLGEYRCKIVTPLSEDEDEVEKYYKQFNDSISIRKTDANNMLLARGGNRVMALINNAEEVPLESVIDLMDAEEFDIDKTDYLPSGIDSLDKEIYGFIDGTLNIWTAQTGTGKALTLDSDLLTEDGYIKMRDAKVGMKIYSDDGKLHNIIGVYPQGEQPTYRVTLSDNTYVDCSEDHLWTYTSGDRKEYRTNTLQYILDNENDVRLFLPMTKHVEFSEKNLPISPYLLGFLIGASFSPDNICNICVPFEELFNVVQNMIPDNMQASAYKSLGGYYVNISMKDKKSHNNQLYNNMVGLEMSCAEPHIPEIYKFSSIQQRISLLSGLVDFHGITDEEYNDVYFSFKSKRLIDDIKFLVESLGGTAVIRTNSFSGITVYTLKCALSSDIILETKITKHVSEELTQDNLSGLESYHHIRGVEPCRYIKSIEYLGKLECQCIMVDSDSHLFLTNNCIVTHNTTFLSQLCVLEAVDRGENVFWFNAELNASQMLTWIAAQAAGRYHTIEYTSPKGFKYYKTTPQALAAIKEYYRNKIFIYDNLLISNAEDVFEKMQYVYRKRGAKVFVLDNWLCLNFKGKTDTEVTGRQVEFITKLIHFCKKNQVEIHIVAHPKKLAACEPLNEYSILGTSNLPNLVDRIFGIEYAKNQDFLMKGCDRELTIFKDRTLGTKGAKVGIFYDRATRRVYDDNTQKYKRYSWDKGTLKYTTPNFPNNGLLVADRLLEYEEHRVENSSPF